MENGIKLRTKTVVQFAAISVVKIDLEHNKQVTIADRGAT